RLRARTWSHLPRADPVTHRPPRAGSRGSAWPGAGKPSHIGYRPEMAKLVRVDHRVDRLDHAFGHVEPEHADHPSVGVVDHRPRLAVDPGQPERGVEHL